MNAPSTLRPVHGRVDARGCLVEADPPLMRLQERAGGSRGGALAVPQLARLVRLARRLNIALSRRIIAADGERDIDLWVEATPDGDGVRIALSGWQEMPSAGSTPATEAMRGRDFGRASADWIIETDAMLRVTLPPASMPGAIGRSLEALFILSCDDHGVTRIADAVRRAERCVDAAASIIIGRTAIPVSLSGTPLVNERGAPVGYQWLASRRDARTVSSPFDAPRQDEGFDAQLGKAMREPLDRIIAHADAIQERGDGPVRRDYADYAEDIAGAGRHLLALVDDLLDLQTIDRPDYRPEAERVDLADSAARAAGLLAVRAARHQVAFDIPAGGPEVMARGDVRRIRQILINLLSNAIRHSPPGGTIWIRCERDRDVAVAIVGDAGEGIAHGDHQRVFERFERLGLRDASGSGLGLYISRRLARAMGGDIAVDSALGEGARFILTLPAAN